MTAAAPAATTERLELQLLRPEISTLLNCADPGTTNIPLGSRPTKQAQHMHAPTSLGVTNVLLRNREEPVLMKTTITGGRRSQASLIWNLYLYRRIPKNQGGVVSQISCSASQLLKNTKPLPLQSLHSAVVGDFN